MFINPLFFRDKQSYRVLRQQLFLPKFLKFWTPPHDFALISGSFELLGCILSSYEYSSLILDQSSGLIALNFMVDGRCSVCLTC